MIIAGRAFRRPEKPQKHEYGLEKGSTKAKARTILNSRRARRNGISAVSYLHSMKGWDYT